MRPLSDIRSEKEWVTANLKKAGLWCAGGVVITVLSFVISSHTGFSIITLGVIGWGGWNVYKCLKRLNELNKEEKRVLDVDYLDGHTSYHKSSSKTTIHSSTKTTTPKLRSKTWPK